MRCSTFGLKFISSWEGKAKWDPAKQLYVPYRDAAGYPTIGVGHLIRPGEDFTAGITEERVMSLLASDVAKCEDAINEYISAELAQNQFDALCSWLFNVGVHAARASTLARLLNLGRYGDVPAMLLEWCHAGGKTNTGLLNRRKAEGLLWSTPYPEPAAATDDAFDRALAARLDLAELFRREDDAARDDCPPTERNS